MPKAVSYYLFEVIESPLCFKRFLKKCSMTGESRDIHLQNSHFPRILISNLKSRILELNSLNEQIGRTVKDAELR